MPAEPIRINGVQVDNSGRFAYSKIVTGSPAAAAETIICTVAAIQSNPAVVTGVQLVGWFAFTAGTNGVTARVRLKQTDAAGATIADSGLVTVVAASLYQYTIQGIDTAAVLPGQAYVMTLIIGSGSATSTVSAASLTATII